ncbi:MAG: DUF72 domain-containing protein [Bacteroidota bacterium]
MKFGKLPDVENIDFTLPPDPVENEAVLKKGSKQNAAQNLYIGATGWGMKEWVGTVYPKGTKAKDYLLHYAKQFNTIELNSTHYGIPNELTLQKWYDQSSEDFRFCPKVLQRISHSRGLSPAGPFNAIKGFCEAVQILKDKLGPCFIQLPPYFGLDRLPILEQFLISWNQYGLALSVEVRHESWFDQPGRFSQLANLLKQYQTATVITDVAGRRDVCHMHLTSDEVVIRFVGNGLHPTDYSRIDAWVERLVNWFGNGLRNAYFFTHEPDNVLAPQLAVYLAKKFSENSAVPARGPNLTASSDEGQQMSLF